MFLVPDGVEVSWRGMDAHTMLDLDRSPDLFETIGELAGTALPDEFQSYVACIPTDEGSAVGWGIVHGRDCGSEAYMVSVAQLTALAHHVDVTSSARNRAAWAYLSALPAGGKLVLFWHF